MAYRSEAPPMRWVTIGLMSGTSLDGIDAACCTVDVPNGELEEASMTVETAMTHSYADARSRYLEQLCTGHPSTAELARADVALGQTFGRAVTSLCDRRGPDAPPIDVIGSHGQTIVHVPDRECLPGGLGPVRSTWQLGDGAMIAAETGIDVVADVRRADIAAGGEGAPLSPLLDWIQFGDQDEHRIVQNIGGIANCSVLPAGCARESIRAFDTGPGNMVIDAVVRSVPVGDRRYDVDGSMASAGTVDEKLLASLLADTYFHRSPPKSTGRGDFGPAYADQLLTAARERGAGDCDVVATATALTAASIAHAYTDHVSVDPDRVVLFGGGAENDTLVTMLRDRIDCPVETARAYNIDPAMREAALLALLAVCHEAGIPGNLPAVTGADRAVVLGKRSPVPPQ